MSKVIKVIYVIFVLIFVLTGCESVPITSYSKDEIAQIKKIKEQKTDDESYKEFLTLFKDFAGFDFEKYLFIPEKNEKSIWSISEKAFYLDSPYILSKSKAENLLEILRNHQYYKTYYTDSDRLFVYPSEILDNPPENYVEHLDTGREDKEKCYCFVRKGKYVDTNVERYVIISILPTDKTCDEYEMYIWASIGREPPEGLSCWPEDEGIVYNGSEILLDKTGKPIG